LGILEILEIFGKRGNFGKVNSNITTYANASLEKSISIFIKTFRLTDSHFIIVCNLVNSMIHEQLTHHIFLFFFKLNYFFFDKMHL